jgi:hypothetical protein
VDERNWPWLSVLKAGAFSDTGTASPSSRKFQQISYNHTFHNTEKDALYHYNFDFPKYHVFYNPHDQNKHFDDAQRAYRIQVEGFSKQLLDTAHPALRSRKWANTCMAVTVRKEEETKSSSIFSMYDADDPVVDFETFYQDDENIVDKVQLCSVKKILIIEKLGSIMRNVKP